jgi:TolB-like protein
MTYKGQALAVKQVGRELGVRYFLDLAMVSGWIQKETIRRP